MRSRYFGMCCFVTVDVFKVSPPLRLLGSSPESKETGVLSLWLTGTGT